MFITVAPSDLNMKSRRSIVVLSKFLVQLSRDILKIMVFPLHFYVRGLLEM